LDTGGGGVRGQSIEVVHLGIVANANSSLVYQLGGAGCVRIIDGLNTLLFMMCQEATDEDQRLLRRNVGVIGGGTHFSNYACWRFQYEDAMQQVCLTYYLNSLFIMQLIPAPAFSIPRFYVSAKVS
jgi:hypothetical protein